MFAALSASLLDGDSANEVCIAENLVHKRTYPVDIFITDLHEDRTRLGEQIARYSEPIAQVRQVAVDTVAPCVAEGLHLLRLARDMRRVAVLHVAAGRAPLEVGVELDAVRRVEIDALHLPAQTLTLGETRH